MPALSIMLKPARRALRPALRLLLLSRRGGKARGRFLRRHVHPHARGDPAAHARLCRGKLYLRVSGRRTHAGRAGLFSRRRRAGKKVERQRRPALQRHTDQRHAGGSAWADFFKENHFLVGVSLDGDRRPTTQNRRDAQGGGSFDRALACVRLLRDSQVEFNVLTVVSRQLARRAGQIYRFYADEGIEHQQYIPCLDPLGEAPGGHAYSLDAPLYARFLEELFEPWYAEARRGRLRYVRYFIGLMNLIAAIRRACAK